MAKWRHYVFFSLTSQFFNAGTNALLVVLLARSLSQNGFGVQALALTILPLVLSLFRGACLEPAVVHGVGDDLHRLVLSDTIRAALLCAIATAAIPFIAKGSLTVGFLLAAGAGLAVVEDAGRWLLARNDRQDLAAAADIGWAIVQVAVLAIGFRSPVVVSGAWAAGAAASVLIAWSAVFLQARKPGIPGLSAHPKHLTIGRYRHSRNAGRRNWHWGFEYLIGASTPQLVLLLAPLGGGVAVAGALSAAMSLSGVATIITGGAQQAAVARLRLINSVRQMRRWASIIGVVLGALVLLASVPLLFIPTAWGIRLLGPSWASARIVLPAIIIQKAAVAISLGAIFVTRRLPTYRAGLWFRLPLTILTVVGAVIGAAIAGAKGAGIVLAAGAIVSVAIWGGIVASMTRRNGVMERYFSRLPSNETKESSDSEGSDLSSA